MDSRICVKNIPKHLTLERFRNHFSAKGEVTDAKIMTTKDGRTRQFGFIGYKTTAEAKFAVHYFHNTFLDTSKISVELAKQIGDNKLSRPWSKYSKGSSAFKEIQQRKSGQNSSGNYPKKRKLDEGIDREEMECVQAEDDERLKTFLEITKPRTNAKKWSNEGMVINVDQACTSSFPKKHIKFSEENESIQEQTMVSNVNRDGVENENNSDEDLPNVVIDIDRTIEREAPDELNEKQRIVLDPMISDMQYLKSKVLKGSKNKKKSLLKEGTVLENASVDESHLKNPNERIQEFTETELLSDGNQFPKSKENKESQFQFEGNQENRTENIEEGRLFIRNLSFSVTEEDLIALFQKFGEIREVHIPIHPETKCTRGIAFLLFLGAENAQRAMNELDGTIFQGRLIHILPAKERHQLTPISSGKKSLAIRNAFKDEREQTNKSNSMNEKSWNSLFMNSDAVTASIAARYGVSKSDVLDRDSSDNLAVRLALAETHLINETKKVLEEQGVCLDTLGKHTDKDLKRSNKILLVKNLSYNVEYEELYELFQSYGKLERLVFPPAKTIALIEFAERNEAKKAFHELSYKKFKHLPLYLEWAPMKIFKCSAVPNSSTVAVSASDLTDSSLVENGKASLSSANRTNVKENLLDRSDTFEEESVSVFVKNLNFLTDEKALLDLFSKVGKVRSVTIAKKKDMKNNGKLLSMGFGFVEFERRDDAIKALKTLQNQLLDGHTLQLKFSERITPSHRNETSKRRSSPIDDMESSSKLLVRNVPFEAKPKDLRELCKPFGQVKSVRIPKKFDGKSRGFAFVEFLTKQEAVNAMQALKSTHLYGRHLIFEFTHDISSIDAIRDKTTRHFRNQEM